MPPQVQNVLECLLTGLIMALILAVPMLIFTRIIGDREDLVDAMKYQAWDGYAGKERHDKKPKPPKDS